jgi:outer membrane lipoprotein LolB
MRKRFWLTLVCPLLLLFACAPLPPAPEANRPSVLGPPLNSFTIDGRLALRRAQRSDHLRFTWRHTPNDDDVLFMSPLGAGVAELTRDAASARLMRPKQPPVVAADLPALAQQVFGAPLPLDALTEWLRGAQPALIGNVDGWAIEITDTMPYRQHRLLRAATIARDDVELKLIVDDWQSDDD